MVSSQFIFSIEIGDNASFWKCVTHPSIYDFFKFLESRIFLFQALLHVVSSALKGLHIPSLLMFSFREILFSLRSQGSSPLYDAQGGGYPLAIPQGLALILLSHLSLTVNTGTRLSELFHIYLPNEEPWLWKTPTIRNQKILHHWGHVERSLRLSFHLYNIVSFCS